MVTERDVYLTEYTMIYWGFSGVLMEIQPAMWDLSTRDGDLELCISWGYEQRYDKWLCKMDKPQNMAIQTQTYDD